jgi:zinc protease
MRAADGYTERVDRKVFAATLAGMRAGRHVPLGAARVVESAGLRELDRFMSRWYRPERTTVVVAGDVDPAAVRALIERELGAWEARGPAPPEPDARATAAGERGPRATVVTDPEQPFAEVRLVRTRPAAPARTVGDWRRRLAARLGVWMINERLREAEGGGGFDDAYAEIEPLVAGLADEAAVYGFAPPGAWRPLLAALVTAVDGAARGGFSTAELARARGAVVAELRARAAGDSTRPAAALAAEMSRAIEAGDPPMSAGQRLALAEGLAPLVDVDEVNAAFADWFSPAGRLTAVVLPARASVALPSRAEVARLAARAERAAARRPPRAAPPEVDALLDEDPVPGEVIEESDDAASGVTSLTLANGVRVHLRPMSERKDEVRVQVTLAGGELLETRATRGLSGAAALAFDTPATDRLPPATIRSHLAGRSIQLDGSAADGDAITGELVAEAADLEKGMRLLYLVLSRGRIPAAALEAWRDRSFAWASEVAADPELRVDAELDVALAAGDERARLLTPAQIARVRLADAQAWFDRHRASAPLEAAMVGDAPREELVRLARKYLGALPARAHTSDWLSVLRHPQAAGPVTTPASLAVDSVTPRAALALAFRGLEPSTPDERDALDLAVASLSDRLRQELRVRRGLTYGVALEVSPSGTLRGSGALTVSLSTDPHRAREAARLARQVVDRFAASGPTADELATARRQVENQRVAAARKPAAWTDRLAALEYRHASLALHTLAAPAGRLAAVTPADVRAAVARYARGDRTLTLVATPRSNLVLGAHARPTRVR